MIQIVTFLFLLIFALLAGAIGAIVALKWGKEGWGRLVLGIIVTAIAFALFTALQFTLFRMFGDDRGVPELIRTGAALLAACSIFWLPSFFVNYWYYNTKDAE